MNPHYTKIRKVKTKSGSTAIQVGYYEGKFFKVQKHIGSSKEKTKIDELIKIGNELIINNSNQLEFDFEKNRKEILFKRGVKIKRSCLDTAYEYLSKVYKEIGFNKIKNEILKHFVIIRILEPASKLRSIELLKKYFDIEYKKTKVFEELDKIVILKEEVINKAIEYAKEKLRFDFSIVFYYVTTLYFETNKSDEFRKNGFSKDNKINQPQILIGLIVDENGFPIYYEIFQGNTFEGKTIIPAIKDIKEKYKIERLRVVADAGMLSSENIKGLEEAGFDYIVGARIGNLKLEYVEEISKELNKTDTKILVKENIIFDYSLKRASKDKVDVNKQILKANYYLQNPSKIVRGSKFLTKLGDSKFQINQELINKHRMLEGIKGYRTNINYLEPEKIIARYKDLWKVEKTFRMAKSDLEARPIYHRKKESIEYHIMIVFMALCMVKVIEIEKQESVSKVVNKLKDMWTITIFDNISGNSIDVELNKS